VNYYVSRKLYFTIASQFEGSYTFSSCKLTNDDEWLQYITSLSSYALFDSLSNLLTSAFKKINTNQGNFVKKDNLLIVMIKLRTAVPNKALTYEFRITPGRVSQIFHKWIDVMARELSQLIVWPDRQMITKTIDCLEIFVERASSLSARSETFSNYKSHNTTIFF